MNVQDYGAIGEIVGGVAVIATLIYLSVQLRQANVATHRNMYAQAATAISEFWLSLAKDYPLYEAFTAMLRDAEGLTRQEVHQGYLVMDAYLSLMESYFLHNSEYGERLSQERWERLLRRFFQTAGGQKYWVARRDSFHKEFSSYVDGILATE